ncbi:MAG: FtsH protease activity modulator HflK [Ruminococcaceae bacterium]|nr:FtsH protease activity modulator HflK [Oscillospiraceae bacterium]
MDNNSNINFKNYRPPVKIKGFIITAIVIVLAILIGSTCWYTVNDKQEAIVTTFGKVTDVTQAGIHFKLPFGIQKVELVDVNIIQKIELGYRSDSGNKPVESESKMISGDYNIVNVDFFIGYKISDPVKYRYASRQPAEILRNLAQSQIRNVIGSFDVDSILTTHKGEIQNQVKELIVAELAEYDIGLMLTDIKIQDAEPPTEAVNEAFKNVETAKQGKDTAINQAYAYKNEQIPAANAQADKLLQNAEYLKQNRINEANKQVAMFNAMFNEYTLNPEITKMRMYYEAIESVFPNVKIIIDQTGSGTQKLLPIDSFLTGGDVQ